MGHDFVLRDERIGKEMRPSFGVIATGHNAVVMEQTLEIGRFYTLNARLRVSEPLTFASRTTAACAQASSTEDAIPNAGESAVKLAEAMLTAVHARPVPVENWDTKTMEWEVGNVKVEPFQLLSGTTRTSVYAAKWNNKVVVLKVAAVGTAADNESMDREREHMRKLGKNARQFACAQLVETSVDQFLSGILVIEPLGRSLVDECLCDDSTRKLVIDALDKGVLKALKYLHHLQYVFYDLWPAQVILIGKGKSLETLLVDFESLQVLEQSPDEGLPIKRGPDALEKIEEACDKVEIDHDLRRYALLQRYVEAGHTTDFADLEYDENDIKVIRDIYKDIKLNIQYC